MPDAAEKALGKLRRLPENQICPNCLKEDVAGFTAICVPFKTFVCSNCKSAHQSFSHRVKSSSQSTWTLDEVKALDEKNGGGNRLARELWMASLPESERPNKDSSLDAIKRFVESCYENGIWKGKEPSIPSSQGGEALSSRGNKEKKHRDRESKRREKAHSGDMGLEVPSTGESSPKHRSRKRKEGREAGGWGAAAGGDAWGLPGNQAMSQWGDGYGSAEPYMRQQPPSEPPYSYPSEQYMHQGLGPFTGSSEHWQPPSTGSSEYFMPPSRQPQEHFMPQRAEQQGHWDGSAQEQMRLTANAHAKRLAPYSAAPAGPPVRQASTTWISARTTSLSEAAGVGKEVTLHPTNPWAEDLGAKLIAIEPTNPWADVVARSFARAGGGPAAVLSSSSQELRPSARSCGSQQTARASQAGHRLLVS